MSNFLNQLLHFDQQLYLALNNLPHPDWLNSIFIFLDYLTFKGAIWIVFCLVLIIFGERRKKIIGVLGLAVLLITGIIEEGIVKNLFARPRPFISLSEATIYGLIPDDFSFPSGHTTNAFSLATFFALLINTQRIKTIAYSLALLVGLQRLYIGVHYPFDVLGGAIIGSIIGYLIFKIFKTKFFKKNSHHLEQH